MSKKRLYRIIWCRVVAESYYEAVSLDEARKKAEGEQTVDNLKYVTRAGELEVHCVVDVNREKRQGK